MPIYEFYCSKCHMIFNFFSPKVNTTKIPGCPKCNKAELERRASMFSISRKLNENENSDMPDLDDAQMERAIQMIEKEAQNIDENDPKQASQLMRRLYDASGLQMGPGMEEALRRMEAGEDPDLIEEELGDVLEQEDFLKASKKSLRKKFLPPAVDDTIYDL